MYAATTAHVTGVRMKSEQELLWLVDTRILKPSDLRDLFAGKKLVDAEAVVLSVEDAERIKKATDQPSARATMHAAIELARGKNGN